MEYEIELDLHNGKSKNYEEKTPILYTLYQKY